MRRLSRGREESLVVERAVSSAIKRLRYYMDWAYLAYIKETSIIISNFLLFLIDIIIIYHYHYVDYYLSSQWQAATFS